MKVWEAIKSLEAFDPEAEVVYVDVYCNDGYSYVEEVWRKDDGRVVIW